MRIGIDARFFSESGVGRYLRNLIKNLQYLDSENEYFIFLLEKDFKDFRETNNFKKILAPFPWYGFAEQFKIPKLLKKYKLDLVHFPHFNVPIFYNEKFIVTIHDLIHQHFQMKRATTLDPVMHKVKQFGYRKVFKTAIKKSEHILVPSNYVKKGLMDEWRVKGDKITVSYEAVDDKLTTIVGKMSQSNIDEVLDKFHINDPYIFYIGNAHPHKNVEGLINAYRKLKVGYPGLELVLSGQDHYFWERLKMENQDEGIIYTGYVSDEQLVALYKGAACFVMPSFEEGFGIPILEAMACNCPVVSSNAGSLQEIGGNGALYFDPESVDDMTSKISQVLDSRALQKILIEKGKKRVQDFSWKKMAEQTLKGYKKCV